jgi:hypothetical protein
MEYAEIGTELRRTVSLESPQDHLGGAFWENQTTGSFSWWLKGWENMRIPRFAFALMLVVIGLLGSGLAILRARPLAAGKVLMLTIKPHDESSLGCPLLIGDTKASPCMIMQGVKSGMVGAKYRIISTDGDSTELGVRGYFAALPAVDPNDPSGRITMSMSVDDVENAVEREYTLKHGQGLEIPVEGFGNLTVTGNIQDHVSSTSITGNCSAK